MGSNIFVGKELKNDEMNGNCGILPSYQKKEEVTILSPAESCIKAIIEEPELRKKRRGDLTEEYGSSENLKKYVRSEFEAHHESIRKGRIYSHRDQGAFVNTNLYRGASGFYDHEKDNEECEEMKAKPESSEDLPYFVVPTRKSNGDYIIHFFSKSDFEKKRPSVGDISFSLGFSLQEMFKSSEDAYEWSRLMGVDFDGRDQENLLTSEEAFGKFSKKLEFQKLMHELKNKIESTKDLPEREKMSNPIKMMEKENYEKREQIWFTIPSPENVDRTNFALKDEETAIEINELKEKPKPKENDEIIIDLHPNQSAVTTKENEIFFNIPSSQHQ